MTIDRKAPNLLRFDLTDEQDPRKIAAALVNAWKGFYDEVLVRRTSVTFKGTEAMLDFVEESCG